MTTTPAGRQVTGHLIGRAAGITVNTTLIIEWSGTPTVMGQAVRAT